MKKLNEVEKTINKHKQELKQEYKVKSIAIFGSYVKGEQKEGSDVDILVEFMEPVSLFCIVSLENIHGYFTVDFEVWLTVKKEISKLKPLIRRVLEDLERR